MFRLDNLRLGFATNSSSSHSVLLGSGPYISPQPMRGAIGDLDFGWDEFRLTSQAERVSYLAAAVLSSLRGAGFPDYVVRGAMIEIFGDALHLPKDDLPYGIDHQSAFTLPDPTRPEFPAIVREAMEFFRDDRVTIFGGNDNEGDGPSGLYDFGGGDYSPIRLRRDGDHYVLMSWATGAKVRLSPQDGPAFLKASRPELVDIKITDFCPYGCAFCYQGSTTRGREGSPYLGALIKALGVNGLGVFEAAIGGGEPTASDHFVSTIEACRDNYIRPNFTTFAVDWLLDEHKLAAAKLCGGIGVSVLSARDIGKVQKIKAALPRQQVIGQHVFGSLPVKETKEIIAAFNRERLPLLLLGFKSVGRGGVMSPHDMRGLYDGRDALREWDVSSLRLSVDTAFVAQHAGFLEWLGTNKASITRQEGAFSFYVDAVEWKVGPSSYDPTAMTALPMVNSNYGLAVGALANALGEAFRSYPGEQPA